VDELESIKQEQKRLEDSVLAAFATKWGQRDGYRRFKLLQEAIPKINDALLNPETSELSKTMHPEHMEMYIQHLIPRVRALLENCGEKLIKAFEKAPDHDARLGMIVKCINLIDEKARALDEARKQSQETPPS
jgi:hypothetical protein